jgi:hypothetical protein
MVQINLSVSFVLAASVIAPVVALPGKGSVFFYMDEYFFSDRLLKL